MNREKHLTPEDIQKALGAERVIPIPGLPSRGPLDLLSLRREVQQRLKSSGGRRTDPSWAITRPIRFNLKRWEQLERLSEGLSEPHRKVSPGQLGAMLIEKAIVEMADSPETPSWLRGSTAGADAHSFAEEERLLGDLPSAPHNADGYQLGCMVSLRKSA